MIVFIDSNIYIQLFIGKPSKDYFDKLSNLLEKNKINLFFPRITREEVYRKVTKTLKEESKEPQIVFPSVPENFKNKKLVEKLKKLNDDFKKEYVAEHKRQYDAKKSMAAKLFKSFQSVNYDDEGCFTSANERKVKRYSPGKPEDPLGDQYTWEVILKNFTDQDLIIVSDDEDWRNKTDEKILEINPFLLEEWKKKAGTKKIQLVETLGELFLKLENKYKVPKAEKEKEDLKKVTSNTPTLSNFILGVSELGTGVVTQGIPLAPISLGTVQTRVSPISTASIADPLTSRQPITLVGTIPNGYVQCYSCGRIVLQNEYYGLTVKGYACKYCIGG